MRMIQKIFQTTHLLIEIWTMLSHQLNFFKQDLDTDSPMKMTLKICQQDKTQ